MTRRWIEKYRSLDTPLGRKFIKQKGKKLQRNGYTYKIKTVGDFIFLYQGRKRK